MQEITYHKAEKKDIETLIDLRIKFTTTLTGIDSPEKIDELTKHLRDYFKTNFENPGKSTWYIARSGDVAVGTGGLMFREHPGNFKTPTGRIGYIINMYTAPEFRRRGICSKILKALVKDGKESGIPAFELHATKEGEFVYKQLGFEIHDEPTYRKYLK